MSSLLCRLFPLVVLAVLVAAPAAADDAALFRISHVVVVGDVQLPAGDDMFRVTPRGLVLVYDRELTKGVATWTVTTVIALARQGATRDASLGARPRGIRFPVATPVPTPVAAATRGGSR